MAGVAARQVEGIRMEEAALGYLGEISQAASLRHAVQLLTPAHVLAKTNGARMRCVQREGRPCTTPYLTLYQEQANRMF